MPPNYPGVNTVTRQARDGSKIVRYYHRATGKRLPGELGSPEFDQAYQAAQRPERIKPQKGPTFASLADEFEESSEFKKAVRTTRHAREVVLKAARARFDWMLVKDLNRRAVRDELMKWRDEMSATPRKADLYMSVLSRLLSWAYDRGRIEFNHGLRVGKLTPAGHSRRERIWTMEHEKALLAAADPEISRLYRFALYSLAREGDIARLRRPSYDGKWIVFTPSKTERSSQVKVFLPVFELPPFAALMDELPECGDALLSTDGRRKPWSATNIRARFRHAMEDAGLAGEDLHFHDIRGTGASRMLDASCTEAEVAAITGHAIGGGSKLSDYANRSRALAINGYRKLSAAMAGDPMPRLAAVS